MGQKCLEARFSLFARVAWEQFAARHVTESQASGWQKAYCSIFCCDDNELYDETRIRRLTSSVMSFDVLGRLHQYCSGYLELKYPSLYKTCRRLGSIAGCVGYMIRE